MNDITNFENLQLSWNGNTSLGRFQVNCSEIQDMGDWVNAHRWLECFSTSCIPISRNRKHPWWRYCGNVTEYIHVFWLKIREKQLINLIFSSGNFLCIEISCPYHYDKFYQQGIFVMSVKQKHSRHISETEPLSVFVHRIGGLCLDQVYANFVLSYICT